jgi:hypothetical protein
MENIELDDFEEKLIALSKMPNRERSKLWAASYDPKDLDLRRQGMSGHALGVYEHLRIGDLEDALLECRTRFHLEPRSREENRLRGILERVSRIAMANESEEDRRARRRNDRAASKPR